MTIRILSITTLLICLFFSTKAYAQNECAHLTDDCEYYACMEQVKKCGRKGYLEAFGHKYCQKFASVEDKFSENGKRWMNDVKTCLIDEISQLDDDSSCKYIKKNSIKSHVPCYINAGYCDLNSKDKALIIKTIKYSLYRPSLIRAGISVLSKCR